MSSSGICMRGGGPPPMPGMGMRGGGPPPIPGMGMRGGPPPMPGRARGASARGGGGGFPERPPGGGGGGGARGGGGGGAGGMDATRARAQSAGTPSPSRSLALIPRRSSIMEMPASWRQPSIPSSPWSARKAASSDMCLALKKRRVCLAFQKKNKSARRR